MCGVSRRPRTCGFESQVRKKPWRKEVKTHSIVKFKNKIKFKKKKMKTHSSILAWKLPWKEEPGRLQSKESKELDMTEWLNMHACKDWDPEISSWKYPTI